MPVFDFFDRLANQKFNIHMCVRSIESTTETYTMKDRISLANSSASTCGSFFRSKNTATLANNLRWRSPSARFIRALAGMRENTSCYFDGGLAFSWALAVVQSRGLALIFF
jgi:hypothetical protein